MSRTLTIAYIFDNLLLAIIMGEVQAGTRPMPAGFADIEADLPVLAWPA